MRRIGRAAAVTAGWIVLSVVMTPAQSGPDGVHPCGWTPPQEPPPKGETRANIEWYSDANVQSGPNDIWNFARSVANRDKAPHHIHWEAARMTTDLDQGFQAWTCVKGKIGRNLDDGKLFYGNLPTESIPTTVYVGKDEAPGVVAPNHIIPLETTYMVGKLRTVKPGDMQVAVSISSTVAGSTARWELKNLTPTSLRFTLAVKGVGDRQWLSAAGGRVLEGNTTIAATAPVASNDVISRQRIPLTLQVLAGQQIAAIDVDLYIPTARIGAGAVR
ncbi:MAG TPA: hypothetical protein VJN96_27130 [Vicinamibacterales bacterium]|nr:hypothetical protein [Vicinamibacterales bacterium]